MGLKLGLGLGHWVGARTASAEKQGAPSQWVPPVNQQHQSVLSVHTDRCTHMHTRSNQCSQTDRQTQARTQGEALTNQCSVSTQTDAHTCTQGAISAHRQIDRRKHAHRERPSPISAQCPHRQTDRHARTRTHKERPSRVFSVHTDRQAHTHTHTRRDPHQSVFSVHTDRHTHTHGGETLTLLVRAENFRTWSVSSKTEAMLETLTNMAIFPILILSPLPMK